MLNVSELWKPVAGYEGRYEVSNMGNVRSIQDNHGRYRERPVAKNRSGTVDYLYVKLFIKDKMTNKAVHRLVAEAFVPNPGQLPVVNHLDGNKRNNCADNLEWTTTSGNHRHAWASGLRSSEHLVRRNLGRKVGDATAFHNVSWDATRSKWKACIKHGGKALFQKRFDTAEAAARYVDAMLDHYGLHDRPRNFTD